MNARRTNRAIPTNAASFAGVATQYHAALATLRGRPSASDERDAIAQSQRVWREAGCKLRDLYQRYGVAVPDTIHGACLRGKKERALARKQAREIVRAVQRGIPASEVVAVLNEANLQTAIVASALTSA
jgi:hypothetical protein